MKKKITATVLTALLIAVSSAFPESNPSREEKIILTSFYPLYIASLNIAKGIPGVKVVNLTKPSTGCLHDYQLTPQEMKLFATAFVCIVNGLGMESFLDEVARQMPDLTVINASQGFPAIQTATEINPHVWVSIAGAIAQVNTISSALQKIDPSHAGRYAANTNTYTDQLEALRKTAHEELKDISRKNIITFHEAFSYFAQEFGLHIAAVVEREPGSEPSAGDLAQIIKLVRARGITAIFAEPQYPRKSADIIAQETGAAIYVLDPVVTGPSVPDAYITIMKNNIAALKKALH